MQSSFWNKKKVLITGHTGFKGGWLSTWLLELGADIVGYALRPNTDPSFFGLCDLDGRMNSVIGDVRDKDNLRSVMQAHHTEIVFHLAAQTLVLYSYREPEETFATNVMGTVHVLDAVRRTPSVRAVVIVTSDKCYENQERLLGYREDEPMGGHDPYSASKGCAELVSAAYRRSFFEGTSGSVGMATVRAGNVIGGGDWREDRLVPDAMRALCRGKPLMVRHPRSVRPWQHVLEPLRGYLMLAERLYGEKEKWAGAWNLGPRDEDAVNVASLSDMIIEKWGQGSWKAVPDQKAPHEAHYLNLDCSKAFEVLSFRPYLALEEAIGITVEWYRKAISAEPGQKMYDMTCDQIRSYEARTKGKQER